MTNPIPSAGETTIIGLPAINVLPITTTGDRPLTQEDLDTITRLSEGTALLISARGAEPIAWGEMPPAARGWLQLMKAMEECVIEAAITGDYGLALEAFTMNPLIESGKEGKQVLDELLVAHEKYLPQFAEKIQELKAAGVETDDEVVRELLRKGL